MSPPSFPSEIFGTFIEALGDDQQSLRACSLVSSVFRHLCGPTLYRDIALDRDEKVDSFIQSGESSELLQYVKSLSLANSSKLHQILDTISQKASLETLRFYRVEFCVEPVTASLLSRLSTVTALVLRECRFGGFEDFVSFIRSFPLCEVLRLRGCSWIRNEDAKLKFGRSPVYAIAPVHLEITNLFAAPWGEQSCDQGEIVGTAWLDLAGLKTFTYAVGGEAEARLMLEKIVVCELLEGIDLDLPHPIRRDFGECELLLWLFDPDFVESIEFSNCPVDPIRRSY